MAFSTYEVAEMLEVNPETVRRWIRTKRLYAERDSKKNGFCISKLYLAIFIYENPKYKNRGFAIDEQEFKYYQVWKKQQEEILEAYKAYQELCGAVTAIKKKYKLERL